MKKSIHDAMTKLAAAESAFVGSELLAPVVRGRGVTVKIANVRCTLAVSPADYQGWGVFRAGSHVQATLVREATAAQRQQYLRLFPAAALIVCLSEGGKTLATPADLSEGRFDFDGPVSVELCGQVDLFDGIAARFDGMPLLVRPD